jgi:hypothetical protein
MAQNGLTRRLTALEEIALECQRSEMRDRILSWPEFAHLTPADLEAATDEAFRILEEIRRCPRT